jgi:hypothetical protein
MKKASVLAKSSHFEGKSASKVQPISNEKCASNVRPLSNEKCADKVQLRRMKDEE